MRTYGQIADGKPLTYSEFLKSVQKKLEMAIGKASSTEKIKKLYNNGYSIEDAVSFLILK